MAIDTTTNNFSGFNSPLKKVAKSTVIVFLGTSIGSILLYLTRLLLIRNWTQAEYGTYVLSLTIPALFLTLSSLGLRKGIVRNIAYNRGKKDVKEISKIITSTSFVFVFLGIIASIALFFLSEFISLEIFNEPLLIMPIKIISISIPALKINNFVVTIFQGYDMVSPGIFYSILRDLLFFAFLLFIIYLGFSFLTVFYAYVISIVVACILLICSINKKLDLSRISKLKYFDKTTIKTLVIFSLPLFGVAATAFVSNFVDTLLLGGIKNVSEVALYNAIVPTSQAISSPLGAMVVIYVPVITVLYSKQKIQEMGRNFSILVKWLFLITLPIFLIFFLFSEEIILFLFGASYLTVANAFKLSCLGAILLNLLGLNNQNLLVIGKTKFIFYSYIVAISVNVALDFLLIPQYGVFGAVFASFISFLIAYLVMSAKIYSEIKLQPLSKNLLKPTFLLLLIMIPFYALTSRFIDYSIPLVVVFFGLCYVFIFLSLIATKSLDKEDTDLFRTIGSKLGLKSFSKK